MQFRYTILYVDDVPATLRFFTEAFGLEIAFVHPSGQYGELLTGSTKLAFSSTALMRALGKSPQPPSPGAPTFEVAFETQDVPQALARALAAGAQLCQEVRDEPWGQTTAYVSSPEGYLIELCTAVHPPP